MNLNVKCQKIYDIKTKQELYSEVLVRNCDGIKGADNIIKYAHDNGASPVAATSFSHRQCLPAREKEVVFLPRGTERRAVCRNTAFCVGYRRTIGRVCFCRKHLQRAAKMVKFSMRE